MEALRKEGISAVRLDSSMTPDDLRTATAEIVSGRVKVLYITPERFNNEKFRRLLGMKYYLLHRFFSFSYCYYDFYFMIILNFYYYHCYHYYFYQKETSNFTRDLNIIKYKILIQTLNLNQTERQCYDKAFLVQ